MQLNGKAASTRAPYRNGTVTGSLPYCFESGSVTSRGLNFELGDWSNESILLSCTSKRYDHRLKAICTLMHDGAKTNLFSGPRKPISDGLYRKPIIDCVPETTQQLPFCPVESAEDRSSWCVIESATNEHPNLAFPTFLAVLSYRTTITHLSGPFKYADEQSSMLC